MITQKKQTHQLKNGNPAGTGKKGMTYAEMTKLIMQHKENRNQFTMGLFQRIESCGDALVTQCVDMAMEGNDKMMLFLMNILVNPHLMNRLEQKLSSRTVKDIDESMQFVVEKMGDGSIEVTHGERLMKALALKRDTINAKDLEDKVNVIMKEEQR